MDKELWIARNANGELLCFNLNLNDGLLYKKAEGKWSSVNNVKPVTMPTDWFPNIGKGQTLKFVVYKEPEEQPSDWNKYIHNKFR